MNRFFKSFKNKLPQSYLSLGILGGSFALCLFSLFTFFSSMQQVNATEETIANLCANLRMRKLKQQEETFFINKLKQSDPFYIDKYLESLSFLEEEVANLQMLQRTNATDETLKQRLRHLKEGSNQLRFSEENMHRLGGMQEVEENQQHPVEINLTDLKKLLSRIEDIAISPFSPIEKAPQLIVKNFDLFRKPVSNNQETYLIQMKLIKREAIHE